MIRTYRQGYFTPQNPEKYQGNPSNIIWRSSWEKEIFKWVDTNPNIIKWASEEIIIHYWNPITKDQHRYFPDLYAEINSKNGIRKCLIEIKPAQHSFLPKKKKRQRQKTYVENLMIYYKNAFKWAAAQEYCKQRGWEFLLLCKDEETNRYHTRQDLLEQAIADGFQALSKNKLRA